MIALSKSSKTIAALAALALPLAAGAQAQETWRYSAFFHAMLDAGVYLPPSAFESWFVSASHDEDALSRLAEALPDAAAAAASAVPPAAT